MKNNVIQSKSYEFALNIIGLYKTLCDQKEFAEARGVALVLTFG
jgi:hypothetical protein